MITAYDSITAADIPPTAQMVLGYANGSWPWSPADWARFPNARQESISVTPFENVGDWLDVETGDAFPWQAPDWVVMRRQAGHPNPGVYVQGSLWQATRNEFILRGIPEPRWWVAIWDGVAQIPSGAFGKQYAAPHPGTVYDSGGHFDLSVFNYTFGGGTSTIGGVVNINEKRAWVLVSYLAGLGRTPETAAVRDNWANSIADDASNLDAVVTNIVNSPEGIDYRAKLAKAILDVESPAGFVPHKHSTDQGTP